MAEALLTFQLDAAHSLQIAAPILAELTKSQSRTARKSRFIRTIAKTLLTLRTSLFRCTCPSENGYYYNDAGYCGLENGAYCREFTASPSPHLVVA
jgi:hypothetical protein